MNIWQLHKGMQDATLQQRCRVSGYGNSGELSRELTGERMRSDTLGQGRSRGIFCFTFLVSILSKTYLLIYLFIYLKRMVMEG